MTRWGEGFAAGPETPLPWRVILPVKSFCGGVLKTNRFLVLFLLVAVVLLTGINVYQNRVIAKQSFEIRWLMANCSQRLPAPAPTGR